MFPTSHTSKPPPKREASATLKQPRPPAESSIQNYELKTTNYLNRRQIRLSQQLFPFHRRDALPLADSAHAQ